MQQESREYLFRRLHSLLGVVPVGLFLIEHFFTNSTAESGSTAFNNAVGFIQHLPYLHAIEFIFIFIPLLYHGVYGLFIAFTAGYNAGQYSWTRNRLFALQRITGIITFVFIVYHLATTRFSGNAPDFNTVATIVSNPFAFWFMIIGIVAATFHFTNGLWSFLIHWGITIGPRAQRISAYVMMIFFVVMSFVGVRALFAFVHAA